MYRCTGSSCPCVSGGGAVVVVTAIGSPPSRRPPRAPPRPRPRAPAAAGPHAACTVAPGPGGRTSGSGPWRPPGLGAGHRQRVPGLEVHFVEDRHDFLDHLVVALVAAQLPAPERPCDVVEAAPVAVRA